MIAECSLCWFRNLRSRGAKCNHNKPSFRSMSIIPSNLMRTIARTFSPLFRLGTIYSKDSSVIIQARLELSGGVPDSDLRPGPGFLRLRRPL
jgi:hypothetical protein